MSAHLFTAEDAWYGGFYEVALGEGKNGDIQGTSGVVFEKKSLDVPDAEVPGVIM
jgi:hypothetical protein